ncbi:MAG: hypothetical protein IPH77_16400 [Ignavibacteria bacterium]|nr:hypothetical protein [Ignavibacteria bacterium]
MTRLVVGIAATFDIVIVPAVVLKARIYVSAGMAVAVICAPTTTPLKFVTFVKTGLLVEVFAVVRILL